MKNLSSSRKETTDLISESSPVIGEAVITVDLNDVNTFFFLTNKDNKVIIFKNENVAKTYVKKLDLVCKHNIESFTDYDFDENTIFYN